MRHGTLDLIVVTAEWVRSEVFVSCADCLHQGARWAGAGASQCPGHVMCCLQLQVMTPCTPERPGTVTTYCSLRLSHATHQLLAVWAPAR